MKIVPGLNAVLAHSPKYISDPRISGLFRHLKRKPFKRVIRALGSAESEKKVSIFAELLAQFRQ